MKEIAQVIVTKYLNGMCLITKHNCAGSMHVDISEKDFILAYIWELIKDKD